MTAQKLNKKGLSSVYETEKQPRRGAVQVPLLLSCSGRAPLARHEAPLDRGTIGNHTRRVRLDTDAHIFAALTVTLLLQS